MHELNAPELYTKRWSKGMLPLWLSSTSPTGIHEDGGSIPGLGQWVKDLALLWLWHRLVAVVSCRCSPKKQSKKKVKGVNFMLCLFYHNFKKFLSSATNLTSQSICFLVFVCFCFCFVFLPFLGLLRWHMEVPRLGGQIGAAAASLHQSHSNAGSEPRLRSTPQLTATPDP